MTNDTSHYAIAGGKQGKARLNVLAEAMYPFTQNLLQKLGVKEGISFLDNGCGGGNVALMVAKMIGNGKVTAVDFDESILALAKQDAHEQNISNVFFEASSAYDIAYQNEFDISYARFLFSHLEQPLAALLKMRQATKIGGLVVVEDIQFSGHFCYPQNDAYNKYLELYGNVVSKKGGNSEIGLMLVELFKQAGIADVQFDVVQPTFTKGNGKWMAYLTLEKIKQSLIDEAVVTADAVDELLLQLKAFTEDETTMMSLPRIFRAWGRKAK